MTMFWQEFSQKPDHCARLPEIGAGYIVLLRTLDFPASAVDRHVSIHPWRKTEAKTLTSLPNLPAFLRSEGMGGGKKLGEVVVK